MVTGASGPLGSAVLRAAAATFGVTRVIGVYRTCRPSLPSENDLIGVNLATNGGSNKLAAALEQISETQLALVHCAGYFPPFAPIHRAGLSQTTQAIASNTLSFIGALQAVIPEMRRRRWGRVLAFSSHTANQNYPFCGSFTMAKAALESAVQVVANENARFGIAANTLSLATLQTEAEQKLKPSGHYEDWISPDDAAKYALDLVTSHPPLLNGSTLQFWGYSSSYFGNSVLARNDLKLEEIDPD